MHSHYLNIHCHNTHAYMVCSSHCHTAYMCTKAPYTPHTHSHTGTIIHNVHTGTYTFVEYVVRPSQFPNCFSAFQWKCAKILGMAGQCCIDVYAHGYIIMFSDLSLSLSLTHIHTHTHTHTMTSTKLFS